MSIAMYLAIALEILMCLMLLEGSVVHNDINVVSAFQSSFFFLASDSFESIPWCRFKCLWRLVVFPSLVFTTTLQANLLSSPAVLPKCSHTFDDRAAIFSVVEKWRSSYVNYFHVKFLAIIFTRIKRIINLCRSCSLLHRLYQFLSDYYFLLHPWILLMSIDS